MFVLLIDDFEKEDKMEDRLLVAKAVLGCYAHLDDLFDALTESDEKCAIDGFYAIYPNEQMRIYERLIALEQRKTGLYNMKYIIEEALRKSKSTTFSLLNDRYLQKKEMSDLVRERDVSLRTLYRQLAKGLEDFTFALERGGFDKKRLIREFGNEPLFLSALNRAIREDDEAIQAKETFKKASEAVNKRINYRNSRRNRPHPDNRNRNCFFA